MFPRPSIPGATLKQRGYHMTEEDQQSNQDAARGKVARLQCDLEHAIEHAHDLAKEYEGLAGHLRQHPANIALEHYAHKHLDYEALRVVVEDVKRSEKELQEAVDHARKLGVPL